MTDNGEIRNKIPMLVQGKLSSEEETELRRVISDSEELQEEFEFWQGIYRVRRELPQHDHSDKVAPEIIDAYARGDLNPLSAEYSELQAKLQDNKELAEDVELLRQALRYLPEEPVEVTSAEVGNLWQRIFNVKVFNRLVVPIATILVIVFGLTLILSGPGNEPLSARVMLKMQNEKRSVSEAGKLPELPVLLRQGTKEVVFSFPTDRVEVPGFSYDISLQPRGGSSYKLADSSVECTEQTLVNQCELRVDDPQILTSLKQGGSFILEVKEEFPTNVALVPAEYEYYFRVEIVD